MVREIGVPLAFEGQTKPSALEVDGYEHNLFSHRTTMIETNQQGFWDYGAGTVAIYAGYAPRGLSQNFTDPISGEDAGWLLQKFTYDANNNVTSRQIAYGNWTNRANYSYS